jgi:hypothetical protein
MSKLIVVTREGDEHELAGQAGVSVMQSFVSPNRESAAKLRDFESPW